MDSHPPHLTPSLPTVAIYQNADFVSGIIQEIYKAGLLEATEFENNSTTGKGDGSEKQAAIAAKANVFPWLTNLGAQGSYTHSQSNSEEVATTRHQKFVYSQEFFLDQARSELRRQELITRVENSESASEFQVGDFIEFEASFEANEANAILDILTPELTAAITRYIHRSKGLEEIDTLREQASNADTQIPVEKISGIREIYDARAENQAALAADITSAIRMDFRGSETKEFYASIGAGQHSLTAVTVCEKEYFKSKDFDRLLDGRFTVLGKVVSPIRENVPILERNKLLSRLQVEALDEILRPLAEEADTHQLLDLDFKTSVEGPSITVLPIAIYV